ncbi:MAG: hypothetical protein KAI90_06485 [Desulfobulbaceae bacterium]|nr:hypothetical protein [Desulfobulbaceae bacterium]
MRADRMLENLYLPKALIGSEWLLFRLSGWIGKIKSLEKAIDPMNHLGVSQALTQKVIDHVKGKLTSAGSSSMEETRVCPLMDQDGVCVAGAGSAGF